MRAHAIVVAALAASCAGEPPPKAVALAPIAPPETHAPRACVPEDLAACHALAWDLLPTDPRHAYQDEAFACDEGQVASCAALGHMMLRGIWGESDPAKALFYLEGACGAGVLASCVEHALAERDVRHDETGATTTLLRLCDERRAASACDEVGRMVERGRGFAPDPDAARRLFEHACDLGDAAGCGDLGRALLSVQGERAHRLLVGACRAHDGASCFLLGQLAKSPARARAHAERACNLGAAAACAWVALLVDPDERSPESLSWLDRACDERDADACERLADRLGSPALRAGADRIEAR